MSVFISVYDTDKAKFFTPKTSPNLNIGARMSWSTCISEILKHLRTFFSARMNFEEWTNNRKLHAIINHKATLF